MKAIGFAVLIYALSTQATFSEENWAEKKRIECEALPAHVLEKDEILVGYALPRKDNAMVSIAPLIVIKQGQFKKTDGSEVKRIRQFTSMMDLKSYPVISEVSWSEMSGEACLWYADIQGRSIASPTLFTTSRIEINIKPDSENIAAFYRLNKTCVDQGDFPENQKPPCTKPDLIAISDLNGNKKAEYWFTTPYMWDTGFSIAEESLDGKSLTPIIEACPGCD
jgi:hypothetical protein